MKSLEFKKRVVATFENNHGGYPMNAFLVIGDVNNNGLVDIVASGRKGRMAWFENHGKDQPWVEHIIDEDVDLVGNGGTVADINGDGWKDIVVGAGGRADEIWWWENPGPAGGPWKQRSIIKTGRNQFHDIVFADVTNSGRTSLVFTNQGRDGGTSVCYLPLPADPTTSPWPNLVVIASGKEETVTGPDGNFVRMQPEEGLAVGDIDDDGENEVVAGTWWFKFNGQEWDGHKFAKEYVSNKIAIGDIDGDGKNEIVLAEGDPCIYGKTQGGKLGWFKPGIDITCLWEEHVLEDGLLDAHSVALGDLTGNGALDIITGEIGVASETRGFQGRDPRILVFENDGKGCFTRHVIGEGTGIHNGVLADIFNTGSLDLVGKPLHGSERWNIHIYSQS